MSKQGIDRWIAMGAAERLVVVAAARQTLAVERAKGASAARLREQTESVVGLVCGVHPTASDEARSLWQEAVGDAFETVPRCPDCKEQASFFGPFCAGSRDARQTLRWSGPGWYCPNGDCGRMMRLGAAQ